MCRCCRVSVENFFISIRLEPQFVSLVNPPATRDRQPDRKKTALADIGSVVVAILNHTTV